MQDRRSYTNDIQVLSALSDLLKIGLETRKHGQENVALIIHFVLQSKMRDHRSYTNGSQAPSARSDLKEIVLGTRERVHGHLALNARSGS